MSIIQIYLNIFTLEYLYKLNNSIMLLVGK